MLRDLTTLTLTMQNFANYRSLIVVYYEDLWPSSACAWGFDGEPWRSALLVIGVPVKNLILLYVTEISVTSLLML